MSLMLRKSTNGLRGGRGAGGIPVDHRSTVLVIECVYSSSLNLAFEVNRCNSVQSIINCTELLRFTSSIAI